MNLRYLTSITFEQDREKKIQLLQQYEEEVKRDFENSPVPSTRNHKDANLEGSQFPRIPVSPNQEEATKRNIVLNIAETIRFLGIQIAAAPNDPRLQALQEDLVALIRNE